ncbi:hypothetical protein GPECTOR_6g769 [Gonium pectorale]|uniref:Hexosyltransferase n=1 Tax=Gonium pectorale TaxID=33097 RepID=A0A150GVI9_GONPE|nr:hypothetical protein GPECTOR_6g769 [Gonium pectorale]|eukprot:KXZ53851.1 hypothetical protein GPECTOR_6g769 [Gonium pectorale]
MVALTTGSLPASSETTLASDGWRVIRVAPVANPGQGPQPKGFPARFAYVYTKLFIFKMTEYKKVVFIDADVLVLRNMDVIFQCPGFCAALRHSERFNSGVMSLVPSLEVYEDVMSKVALMPSYTGGDQGFLNSYFTGFAHAPLFDPSTTYTPDQYKYMRLPTTFNADIGLYVVGSNRWMLPRSIGNGGGGGSGEVFPKYFVAGSLAAGYGCVVVVVITTILVVPLEVDPLYGWILSYEWGFLLLGLTYGAFLRSCYRAGRRAGHHPAVQAPKQLHTPQLPLMETALSSAFLVGSLLLAPWLGRILGITSFAGTIVATVFIGLGVIVVSTVQFLLLPAQWYIAGRLAASTVSGPRAV